MEISLAAFRAWQMRLHAPGPPTLVTSSGLRADVELRVSDARRGVEANKMISHGEAVGELLAVNHLVARHQELALIQNRCDHTFGAAVERPRPLIEHIFRRCCWLSAQPEPALALGHLVRAAVRRVALEHIWNERCTGWAGAAIALRGRRGLGVASVTARSRDVGGDPSLSLQGTMQRILEIAGDRREGLLADSLQHQALDVLASCQKWMEGKVPWSRL